MNLKNKVILITGSSRGIGLEIAQAFALKGAHIVLNARKPIDTKLINLIKGLNTDVIDISADITDATAVKTMIDQIINHFGQLDVVVNNAGITQDVLLNQMTENDFKCVINTNLIGTFNVLQCVLEPMYRQRRGCIINLSSVVGIIGSIGQANYAASKAGIIGLTKSAAKEIAVKDLRCNAIAPGMISTDMTQKLSAKIQKRLINKIPLKRMGYSSEIAQTAIFLAENDYITGQVITVDGGFTA